ncbi:uncharacterized protein LOC133858437 isoform X2 [Alnus glutinosa]|uniref:uncharacterized protein LOC133858437 isoform X2 n=1 Tax=Alnus glutinosa TaxID=3517 RepID=UPI002D79D3F1|nr:uncharacterized protein LOC133858437 isoform X2 [Alnus glutinosa]
MAAMLRSARGSMSCVLGLRRLSHAMALPPPLDGVIHRGVTSPPCVLPEFDQNCDDNNNNIGFGLGFSNFPYGGSMELMAVPKKKTSPHKRGIRNGPKALKPIPVIMRCNLAQLAFPDKQMNLGNLASGYDWRIFII